MTAGLRVWVACAALLWGPAWSHGGWGQSSDRAEPVPRLPTAREQLAYARKLKGKRLEASQDRKAIWMERAVGAYRMVRELHPNRPAIGAEAAFRAGMLLAAAAHNERALAEFDVAVRFGVGTEFSARARIESGHVHRRCGDVELALDAYLALAFATVEHNAEHDDAWLFAGDMWHALGATTDARRAWSYVSGGAKDPCTRIFAFDRLGDLKLREEDFEGAAWTLNDCVRSTSKNALERTHQGQRVRRALAKMRLVRELPRRIEQRWNENRSASLLGKALTTPSKVSPHAQ